METPCLFIVRCRYKVFFRTIWVFGDKMLIICNCMFRTYFDLYYLGGPHCIPYKRACGPSQHAISNCVTTLTLRYLHLFRLLHRHLVLLPSLQLLLLTQRLLLPHLLFLCSLPLSSPLARKEALTSSDWASGTARRTLKIS